MREYKAGIVPATTQMGRELLEWLGKWHFPATIMLFDEAVDRKTMKEHHGKLYGHYPPNTALFETCDILFDCDEEHSLSLPSSEKIYIIHLHNQKSIGKLVVPSLNIAQLNPTDHKIQIPFASFMLFAAIYGIIEKYQQVKQAIMTSLHSVAEMGDDACMDLANQLRAYEQGESIESKWFPLPDVHPHLPLLFQALPQTSYFTLNGESQEEQLFHRYAACLGYDLALSLTCVRTASLRGLSISMSFLCDDEIHLDELVDAFSSDPSMICFDDIQHNIYPICADVIHDYRIYIGRMRKSDSHTFTAWAVCDDLAIRCSAAIKCAFYILHNFL